MGVLWGMVHRAIGEQGTIPAVVATLQQRCILAASTVAEMCHPGGQNTGLGFAFSPWHFSLLYPNDVCLFDH